MAAVELGFDKQKLDKAAFILKAVAHPVRLAIIQLLASGEGMSVNDICEKLSCEQSLISHHLINMKLRGILQSTRDGINIYYSLKEKRNHQSFGLFRKMRLYNLIFLRHYMTTLSYIHIYRVSRESNNLIFL